MEIQEGCNGWKLLVSAGLDLEKLGRRPELLASETLTWNVLFM